MLKQFNVPLDTFFGDVSITFDGNWTYYNRPTREYCQQ